MILGPCDEIPEYRGFQCHCEAEWDGDGFWTPLYFAHGSNGERLDWNQPRFRNQPEEKFRATVDAHLEKTSLCRA